MTKQVGRCPAFLDVVTTAGVDGYVAVDMACARAIVANGHNLGHLGHLVQVPIGQSDEAATLEADYQTVFTPDKAARASATASKLGHQQDLLLRVHGPGDQLYPGHQGGIEFDELPAAIDHIAGLPNVRFAGLITFPRSSSTKPAARSAQPPTSGRCNVPSKSRPPTQGVRISRYR